MIILGFTYVISGTTVTFIPTYIINYGVGDPSIYLLLYTLGMMFPRILLKDHMPKTNQFPAIIFSICLILAFLGVLSNSLLLDVKFLYLAGAVFSGTALGIIYPAIMSYTICSVSKSVYGISSSLVASAADIGVIISNIGVGISAIIFGAKAPIIFPLITSSIALIILFFTIRKNKVSLTNS